MKVICVEDEFTSLDWLATPKKYPKCSEECYVVKYDNFCGYDFYMLIGYVGYWDATCFMPCSDMDEMELVNEKVLVNS